MVRSTRLLLLLLAGEFARTRGGAADVLVTGAQTQLLFHRRARSRRIHRQDRSKASHRCVLAARIPWLRVRRMFIRKEEGTHAKVRFFGNSNFQNILSTHMNVPTVRGVTAVLGGSILLMVYCYSTVLMITIEASTRRDHHPMVVRDDTSKHQPLLCSGTVVVVLAIYFEPRTGRLPLPMIPDLNSSLSPFPPFLDRSSRFYLVGSGIHCRRTP